MKCYHCEGAGNDPNEVGCACSSCCGTGIAGLYTCNIQEPIGLDGEFTIEELKKIIIAMESEATGE